MLQTGREIQEKGILITDQDIYANFIVPFKKISILIGVLMDTNPSNMLEW